MHIKLTVIKVLCDLILKKYIHVDASKIEFFLSCRPPATVLAKPTPVRNRKDSSDAEPSPPNSPSYFEEDIGDHESSITVSLKHVEVVTISSFENKLSLSIKSGVTCQRFIVPLFHFYISFIIFIFFAKIHLMI